MFGDELLGPLIESCLVGGLTVVLVFMEFKKFEPHIIQQESEMHDLMSEVKGIPVKPFIILAFVIFLVNALLLVIGYLISILNYEFIALIFIISSYIIFIMAIFLLIREIMYDLNTLNKWNPINIKEKNDKKDVINKIKDAKELLDDGTITNKEFQKIKGVYIKKF